MHLFDLDKFVEHQDNIGSIAQYSDNDICNMILIKKQNLEISMDYLRKMLE